MKCYDLSENTKHLSQSQSRQHGSLSVTPPQHSKMPRRRCKHSNVSLNMVDKLFQAYKTLVPVS